MPYRAFVAQVLADVRDSTCSALEHRYLTHVERAHGLPTPVRQAPTESGRPGFRDIAYPEYRLVIELDGRLFHSESVSRDRDLERDLDAAVGELLQSVRLGWGAGRGPCVPGGPQGRRTAAATGPVGHPAPVRDAGLPGPLSQARGF